MTEKLLDVVVIGWASKITLPGLARLYAYIWIASSSHVIIVLFFLVGCVIVIYAVCCMQASIRSLLVCMFVLLFHLFATII